ncbi:MAG TPA: FAD-binding oxidoreductase [Thermodesulfobacteriota bacterium]|nr:FAD-binding oxidoreductase [Thermodesulfobacteriota bacterium]
MSGNGKIENELAEIVGSSGLIGEGSASEPFAVEGLFPKWALFPKTREEVRGIVSLCQKESLSIIPRGNGTKMGMGGVPRRADLLISTGHLNRVVDKDCENLTLTLETGAPLSDVQQQLRKEGIGYFIPIDPPYTERATLGGILATNSSGPKRLLYGTARDLVLGMKVVTADGKLISCGGKTVKNVSGYDMTKLFIGSFGTLGVIIEATLRLLPLPEREQTVVAAFSNPEKIFQVVKEILKSQLISSSLEVLNPRMAEEIAKPLITVGDYALAIGFEGVTEAVQRQVDDVREVCSRFHSNKVELLGGDEQEGLWKAIRDSSPILQARYPKCVVTKINVPISQTPQAFALSEAIAAKEGYACAVSSHAGNGIIFVTFPFEEMKTESDQVARTIHQLTEKAVEMGGNLVVEAAPVSIKKQINVWGQEGSDVPVFRQLKSQLDPSSLFNPGRFVGGL